MACVGTLSQALSKGSKGPLNVTEEMIDLAVVDAFILSGGLPCMGINISVDHPYGFFPFFNCVVFHQVWVVLLAIKLKWIKKIKLKLVYLNGNNAAEGENNIKYANSYPMNWTVKNWFAQDKFESLW